MKHLSKPTKADILLNMFDEVGKTFSVDMVCEVSGIKNYMSLKAMFSYIRRAKHIPDENRIDVRIKDEQCVRVN
jgi:hypothetical protein